MIWACLHLFSRISGYARAALRKLEISCLPALWYRSSRNSVRARARSMASTLYLTRTHAHTQTRTPAPPHPRTPAPPHPRTPAPPHPRTPARPHTRTPTHPRRMPARPPARTNALPTHARALPTHTHAHNQHTDIHMQHTQHTKQHSGLLPKCRALQQFSSKVNPWSSCVRLSICHSPARTCPS